MRTANVWFVKCHLWTSTGKVCLKIYIHFFLTRFYILDITDLSQLNVKHIDQKRFVKLKHTIEIEAFFLSFHFPRKEKIWMLRVFAKQLKWLPHLPFSKRRKSFDWRRYRRWDVLNRKLFDWAEEMENVRYGCAGLMRWLANEAN